MLRSLFVGAIAIAAAALPAHAEIIAMDAYARTANQKTGAAFVQIMNHGPADRLIAAEADVARRVELHTHIFDGGIAKMRRVEGGVPLPEGGSVPMERGGLHVMFMGLTRTWTDGGTFPLTLRFESGAALVVPVTIDSARRPDAPMQGMGHGAGHGAMTPK